MPFAFRRYRTPSPAIRHERAQKTVKNGTKGANGISLTKNWEVSSLAETKRPVGHRHSRPLQKNGIELEDISQPTPK